MIDGVASVVSGVEGGVVAVMVSPIVASDVAAGPGVGSSAELTELKATPTTPIAITALAPTAAEKTLKCVDFTSPANVPYRSKNRGKFDW